MCECGYMNFRFDNRHLKFLCEIGVCYHWKRSPWVHPTKSLTYNVILFSHITYITIVYYVLPYCLFRWISPKKLLIWRHAYWGHVILKSWNWYYPVVFVHKGITNVCHISSDHKVTQQRVPWGYFSPICNTRVNGTEEANWYLISTYV